MGEKIVKLIEIRDKSIQKYSIRYTHIFEKTVNTKKKVSSF